MAYVLCYLSMKGCGFCEKFAPEWKTITETLQKEHPSIQYYKFVTDPDIPDRVSPVEIPPCLREYAGWFPSIVMVPYDQYYNCFSETDLKDSAHTTGSLKAKKYSAVYDDALKQYIPGPHPYKAENILAWIKRVLEGKDVE